MSSELPHPHVVVTCTVNISSLDFGEYQYNAFRLRPYIQIVANYHLDTGPSTECKVSRSSRQDMKPIYGKSGSRDIAFCSSRNAGSSSRL